MTSESVTSYNLAVTNELLTNEQVNQLTNELLTNEQVNQLTNEQLSNYL